MNIDEKYKRAMIYTIRNIKDDTLIYVGSTINTLSKRFDNHKRKCKYGKKEHGIISLYNYIENNDWTDWYIELYEQYSCNNKNELNRREGQVIREIGTLNRIIAGRSKKEYYEDNIDKLKEKMKEYREENVDKIKQYNKQYREENADKFKEYQKEYREQNADKFKEYYKEYYEQNIDRFKEYYEQNTDKIKEKSKEKVCCNICGTFLTKNHLPRHQRTKKCMSKNSNSTDISNGNHI